MIEVGVFFGMTADRYAIYIDSFSSHSGAPLHCLCYFFSLLLFLPLHRSLVQVSTRAINGDGDCRYNRDDSRHAKLNAHVPFSLNCFRPKLAVDLTKSFSIYTKCSDSKLNYSARHSFHFSFHIYHRRTSIHQYISCPKFSFIL